MTLCFFFFQAEDGIRDWSVTGVQTCALPISTASGALIAPTALCTENIIKQFYPRMTDRQFLLTLRIVLVTFSLARSEERRVGKGCGSRWTGVHSKPTPSGHNS